MNLYKIYLSEIKSKLIKNKSKINLSSKKDLNNIIVENPPEKFNFDFSSNVAMVLAKNLADNPRNIAEKIKKILIEEIKDFSKVEVAGPGFLNFKLTDRAWIKIIESILKAKKKFGSNNKKKKVNIEFVSANPTGPLHVGHCRGAVFGDVLSNLLKFNGNKVTKEFYINDYGNQIDVFTKSVFFRLREIKHKETFPKGENLYPGEYIIDIANKILKSNSKINLTNFEKIYKTLKKESLKHSINLIKSDLKQLGIKHDYFFSETKLVNSNLVEKTVNKLKKNKFVEYGFLDPPKGEEVPEWKKIKRLIFKSTLFGDDSNRALQKNDGSWTYFANDVAYHSTKVSRNYDYLLNILGADHTGYIKRISAAVSALSKNKVVLICKVCQLVKLFKCGNPYKMSKRLGDFISVNDLLKEVNRDSIRFMMLNRGNDVELEFDFDKVLEKSKENPVFYVQYSYARINSLFSLGKINLKSKITLDPNKFEPNIFEYKLLRKIAEWPRVVDLASNKFEPHRIPFYLYELVTIFHSYWSKGNDDMKFKFIVNGKINNVFSFKIFQLVAIVLENAMHILGVSLPKKM
jgi:arginyl-tRNA synthetase